MNEDVNKSFKEYQKNNFNKVLNNKLINLIKNIPDSNGSRYYKKIDLKIAIITDEFMYNYYKDAVNLVYINYFDYKNIMENNDVDIFMFVSCWNGVEDNDWRGGIPLAPLKIDRIYEVIDWYKAKGIPTVFQSIEDPSNYVSFKNIAKKCDYIFTSDKDMIPEYKTYCSNENVFLLEYGVNPIFHNPIGIKANEKLKEVLFAGSWMKRYEDRCVDMVKIFDGVLESERKLDIIDRNFDLEVPFYYYPLKYIPYTSPAVGHSDLQKIQKLYDYIINLNSIKYSSTMCAMRVYEAQALGNIILSNYSTAVNNYNPNVFIINDKSEVTTIMNSFNQEDTYKYQVDGIRNVMTNQTVFERLKYIFDTINYPNNINLEKNVLVIAKKLTPRVKEMFENQSYKNKFLVDVKDVKNLKDEYDFVTFFKEDYTYEEYYLQDMINAFKYTNSDYVTKSSYYYNKEIVKGIEHNYVQEMKDKYKTVFDNKFYKLVDLIGRDGVVNLANGYSIDHFELKVETNDYKSNSKEYECGKIKNWIINSSKNIKETYKLSVIVPINDNNKRLLTKCFNSLRRSSMFKEMEIILVDRGSRDLETLSIINRIGRTYPNIVMHKFNQGQTVSNLEAINKGVELSTSQFITVLYPYNESMNDGYKKLYEVIKQSDYDMVMGHILMLTNEEVEVKYSQSEETIYKPKEHIIESKMKINSIQSTIISRDFILNNNLFHKDNIIPEDIELFIRIMMKARKIRVIDELIYKYYGRLENIRFDEDLFDKYYVEQGREMKVVQYEIKDKNIENFI